MRKLLNNPVVVITAVIVAIVVGGMSLLGDNRSGYTYVEEEDFSLSPLPSSSDGNVTYMTKDEIENALNLAGLDFSAPDPFYKPLNSEHAEDLTEEQPATQATETYHLSAIWEQTGATLLLINNRICTSGERIGKLLLDTISNEGVWVIRNGDRNFLPMGGTLTFTSTQFKN